MGSEAKTEGVGIFVAEKWVDSVVSVERHSERILVLKMVLGDCLLNVFTVYAPHSGKPDEVKECFWNEVFHLVSCIPQNEMVVFAGDMNGHVGSSNASVLHLLYDLRPIPRDQPGNTFITTQTHTTNVTVTKSFLDKCSRKAE